jgi:hypothetical protein
MSKQQKVKALKDIEVQIAVKAGGEVYLPADIAKDLKSIGYIKFISNNPKNKKNDNSRKATASGV